MHGRQTAMRDHFNKKYKNYNDVRTDFLCRTDVSVRVTNENPPSSSSIEREFVLQLKGAVGEIKGDVGEITEKKAANSDKFCTCSKPNLDCLLGKLINLTEIQRDLLLETELREVMFSHPKGDAELRKIVHSVSDTLEELKKGRSPIPTDKPFQMGSYRLGNSCMPIQQFSSIENSSVIRGVCSHVIVSKVFDITFEDWHLLDPNLKIDAFGVSSNKVVTKL